VLGGPLPSGRNERQLRPTGQRMRARRRHIAAHQGGWPAHRNWARGFLKLALPRGAHRRSCHGAGSGGATLRTGGPLRMGSRRIGGSQGEVYLPEGDLPLPQMSAQSLPQTAPIWDLSNNRFLGAASASASGPPGVVSVVTSNKARANLDPTKPSYQRNSAAAEHGS
jgi:hypothetical protein